MFMFTGRDLKTYLIFDIFPFCFSNLSGSVSVRLSCCSLLPPSVYFGKCQGNYLSCLFIIIIEQKRHLSQVSDLSKHKTYTLIHRMYRILQKMRKLNNKGLVNFLLLNFITLFYQMLNDFEQ